MRSNGASAVALSLFLVVPIIASILVLSLGTGDLATSLELFQGKRAAVEADRLANGALVLQSFPKGYLEYSMPGYQVKVDGETVSVKYGQKEVSRSIPDGGGYSRIKGPGSYQEVDRRVCLRKTGSNVLEVSAEGC